MHRVDYTSGSYRAAKGNRGYARKMATAAMEMVATSAPLTVSNKATAQATVVIAANRNHKSANDK